MAVLVTVPKVELGDTAGTTGARLDFIIWTSIDYGLTRVGAPVMFYDDQPDLSSVKELCIVGHGLPGQIEGRSAASMAAMLTRGTRALPSDFRQLIVTSCYAGVTVNGVPGTAVIDVIAAAFRKRNLKGIEIAGAMGPSIKANELGSTFKVVSDVKKGSPIQDTKILSNNLGVTGIDGKVLRYQGTTTDPVLAEQAAAMMAKISGEFYKEFVNGLESKRALMDPANTMRTVVS